MIFLYILALLLLRQSAAQEQLLDYEAEKELFKARVAGFFVTQLRPIRVKDFVTHGYGKCPHNRRGGYGIVYGMMNVTCPYDEADLCNLHGTQNSKEEVMVVECQYSGEMKDFDLGRPWAIACYQKWDRQRWDTPEETLCRKWNYPGTQLPRLQLPEHVRSPQSGILLYKPVNVESFSGDGSRSQEADASSWPKNEYERTGFSGQGKLAQFGPNSAVLLLITSYTDWTTKVIVEDTDDYIALPHFWVKKGTIDDDYIERKVQKLNKYCKESEISHMVKNRRWLHTGYLKSKLNTDNAWLEGSIFHLHDETGGCFGPYPTHESATSRKYRWQVLSYPPEYLARFFTANYK